MDTEAPLDGVIDMISEERDLLQAENKRMREALDILARLGNGGYYGTSECNMIARAALDALPNITKRTV